LTRRPPDRPFQDGHQSLQPGGQIGVEVGRPLNVERLVNSQDVSTTDALGENGHDGCASFARDAQRSDWKRGLAAKENDRLAVQEKVAVDEDRGATAAADNLDRAPDAGGRSIDYRRTLRSAEVRDAVEDEAGGRAGGDDGQGVAEQVESLTDEVEGAEVRADDDDTAPLGERSVQPGAVIR
jgi:hypothetical protein